MPAARIVLVEDHRMVRRFFAHLIREKLGHDLVAEATTVEQAVPTLLAMRPDLAIVDWALPNGTGLGLVRTVARRLGRTRWLLLAADDQVPLAREAAALGVQGFVLKRTSLAGLRTAITRVLAGDDHYCAEGVRLLTEERRRQPRGGVALNVRERAVLCGFASGKNPKSLSAQLGVTPKTIQNHLSLLKAKLGVSEAAGLVHYAIKHGYITAP